MNNQDHQFVKPLKKGWAIRAASEVKEMGKIISQADYELNKWYPVVVPTTVLAGLVQNGVYKDPYFGLNLKEIAKEQFENSWWYRTEFALSREEAEKTVLLELEGINYRANIWLNGKEVADSSEIIGAFRRFQFKVAELVREGSNALAVEVIPPKPGEFSTGFVDWNPPPPDRNMGIFREVRLRLVEDAALDNPFVQTKLNLETLKEAALNISAELTNHSELAITGTLKGEIGNIKFSQKVTLEAGQKKKVEFSSVEFEQLQIGNPRIWWPHDMGEPELYELQLKFVSDNKTLDRAEVRFGIREVEDYFTPQGHKGFKVNGKKVLIKGAGWSDDMFLADTPKGIEAQLQYVKHMNLNCIRLEGIWGKDHTIYDLCDQYGILMMVGWSCHWEHEQYLGKPVDERFGGVITTEDIALIGRSWQDQVVRLRNHPSIYVWSVASDKVPAPELEKNYLETFHNYDSTRPYLSSTGGIGSEQKIIGSEIIISDVSGSTGVKMLGPYDYTPPVYWYTDKKLGGAYGFNTETGPGAQVPALDSIKKIIPAEHLWPIDEYWDFHCGLNEFNTLKKFKEAINKRLGQPQTIEEFDRKGQLLNYELMRPMFEAFRTNKGIATGIVQWMLNGAWGKMYWQLYDIYLRPNGAFYGCKKACEPLQLVYNYGDHGVYMINDQPAALKNYKAIIRILDIYSQEVLNKTISVEAEPQAAVKLYDLPKIENISTTYFLDLRLLDEKERETAINFYWLSTKPDVLDYKTKVQPWSYYTPSKEYADFTLLNSLLEAKVKVEYKINTTGKEQKAQVKLENTGDALAFFIELKIVDRESSAPILPVFWEDNYISLLPGEVRQIEAGFKTTKGEFGLIVQGWNLASKRYE